MMDARVKPAHDDQMWIKSVVMRCDAARRYAFIVATLLKLKEQNRLAPVHAKWLSKAEAQLAKMR